MIINDVMDQIGAQLDTIDGLRVWDYDSDDIEPPAAIIRLTGDIDYLGTYDHGAIRFDLSVLILVSSVDDRVRRNEITSYADTKGPKSIMEVLESGNYTAFDTITVSRAKFNITQIATIKYVAVEFTNKILGRG